jgi:5-oxoprolinase (ATP-hydrolysing)
LVGQFGSFIGQFLKIWTHKVNKGDVDDIEEGDVFVTNGTRSLANLAHRIH